MVFINSLTHSACTEKEKMRFEWNWMCRVFIAGTECGAAREAGKILMNLMSGAPEEEKDE